jgi:hypothetical protein
MRTTKKNLKEDRLRDEIRTRDLPDRKQGCETLYQTSGTFHINVRTGYLMSVAGVARWTPSGAALFEATNVRAIALLIKLNVR